jgi:hypothetical protein
MGLMTARNRTRAEYRATKAATPQPTPQPTWDPGKLYRAGHEFRRILFLEIVAAGIVRIESCRTSEEYAALTAELRATRARVWGPRPWPRAKDSDSYLKHVAEIARAFAESDGSPDYPRRSVGP